MQAAETTEQLHAFIQARFEADVRAHMARSAEYVGVTVPDGMNTRDTMVYLCKELFECRMALISLEEDACIASFNMNGNLVNVLGLGEEEFTRELEIRIAELTKARLRFMKKQWEERDILAKLEVVGVYSAD